MAEEINKTISVDITKGNPAGPLQPVPLSGGRGATAPSNQPVPSTTPTTPSGSNTTSSGGSAGGEKK